MRLNVTKTPAIASIARISAGVILMMTALGCAPVPVDLDAARVEINPLIKDHADALADGTWEDAMATGRSLIAKIDCLLDNPECG